ncbi:MAG TPA: PPOX class F420-dependent oxidoreductase, partial [Nitrososphaera sp.]|nr:PPOX class F420-dependent oxidoreductase [Nitrososphaera sp.]
FAGEKYLNIETYRKSGEAVRTPVWFVESGGVLYVRTSEDTGKYKRIRNNPNVSIAPCDSRGKVKGEWVKAEARQAPQEQADAAYRLMEKKYGMMYRMSRMFLRGRRYAVLEIRAIGD